MTVTHPRWLVKKAARCALMLGATTARRLAADKNEPASPSVRVLTYHRFAEASRDPWSVRPDIFEQHMRFVAERGLAVSLDQVLRFARGEITLPNGSVLITMDDGFSSVRTVAAPIMKRYGVPGVAYITTSLVESDSTTPDGERYLTWQQASELPAFGLVVGSHAHTHRSLGRMTPAEAREEGATSKRLLTQHIDQPIESFAYPFGMRPDETPETARVLGEVGYTSVFIAQHGTIERGADVLRLPRVKVEGGEPAWALRLTCEGAMDRWKLVDELLWRLQRPGA